MNKLSKTAIEIMWIDELDKLAIEVRKDLEKNYSHASNTHNPTDIDSYKP
jgi:hypothetical protein